MTRPLLMRETVTFEAIAETRKDSFGGVHRTWEPQFRSFANVELKAGSEEIIAASLRGKIPGILTIRNSAQARRIDRRWRVIHRGQTYEIKEAPRLNQHRTHLTMTIEGMS